MDVGWKDSDEGIIITLAHKIFKYFNVFNFPTAGIKMYWQSVWNMAGSIYIHFNISKQPKISQPLKGCKLPVFIRINMKE